MPPALAGVKRLRYDWPSIISEVGRNGSGLGTAPISEVAPDRYRMTVQNKSSGHFDQSACCRASQMDDQRDAKTTTRSSRKTPPQKLTMFPMVSRAIGASFTAST